MVNVEKKEGMMFEERDSWDRWKRDVEGFRTISPCKGQKYRWLKGYLGNPNSKTMFICEIPSLSRRFTQQQPESTDENLQWNVHDGDRLFRNMLYEFSFKTNSPKETGGWKCWITDFIKCPIEDRVWRELPRASRIAWICFPSLRFSKGWAK